jgi:hypothetical protein
MTWYAGVDSTDGGGNTGWIFTHVPAAKWKATDSIDGGNNSGWLINYKYTEAVRLAGAFVDYPSAGSLRITDRINARTTGAIGVIDLLGVNSWQQGTPVEIYDEDVDLIFGGFVQNADKKRINATAMNHDLTLMDMHYLADKRVVAESYTDKSCGYMVQDIITNYLAAEGVTVGLIEDGSTLSTTVFPWIHASDAFDMLAQAANFIWYIDYDKKLYFMPRDSVVASAALNTTTNILAGSVSYAEGNPKYRNTQFIPGGMATTDLQTEQVLGDGVTRAFTFGYPLAEQPNEIKLDGAGAALTFGIKGVDTGKDFYWSKGDPVLTQDSGGVVLTDAHYIQMKYYGQHPIVAEVPDDSEIESQLAIEGSGTGIVEEVDAYPNITDRILAIDTAISILKELGKHSNTYKCSTLDNGFAAGQLVLITDPAISLTAEQMLITEVGIKSMGGYFRYDITAISGPVIGDWTQFFKGMAKPSAFGQDINAGASLIKLKRTEEAWNWASEMTIALYVCAICGDGTTCGDGTVVC